MGEGSAKRDATVSGTALKTKKALIVTTVSGFVPQFEMNNVRILQGMGYEVHYASNFWNPSYGSDNSRLNGTGIIRHQVDFARSPFQVKENDRAYRQLKQLLKEQQFELLHCHTPVGAALSRIAARTCQRRGRNKKTKRLKVIYTAHGFHFYKGAPLKYWLLFYPVERWLAHFTDVLITINEEDYKRANKFCRHKKTKVKHIAGIGIDTSYFSGKELTEGEREAIRDAVRKRLHVKEGELLFLSVGELIPRKNHAAVIQAFAEIKKGSSRNSCNFRYAICGQGVLKEELQRQIDMAELSEKIYLPGYQKDVRGLLYAADVFVFPSHQEGMPVALMEAIAADVPVIASDIRGNRELLRRQENAIPFADEEGLRRALEYVLKHSTELRTHDRRTNSKMGDFDIEQVGKQMQTIYKELET